MAKKSAICGEYIITVQDSGSIKVSRIYDNVKGSLREISEKLGFGYDPGWTTRQFGTKLIQQMGDGSNVLEAGEYVIAKRSNGSIETYREYDNTKGALREIAEKIDFDFYPAWTTRQFGNKLVDFLNNQ